MGTRKHKTKKRGRNRKKRKGKIEFCVEQGNKNDRRDVKGEKGKKRREKLRNEVSKKIRE